MPNLCCELFSSRSIGESRIRGAAGVVASGAVAVAAGAGAAAAVAVEVQ